MKHHASFNLVSSQEVQGYTSKRENHFFNTVMMLKVNIEQIITAINLFIFVAVSKIGKAHNNPKLKNCNCN
jgi:hypothetical protein